jgi:hypothetical protein
MTSVAMSAISGRASASDIVSMRSLGVVTAWAKMMVRSPQPASRNTSSALAKPSGLLADRGL